MNCLCSFHGFLEVLKKKSPQRRLVDLPEDTYRHFSLAEIKAATNNFCPVSIIGRGGFGSVYKGTLDGEVMVAVKRLSVSLLQGRREFRNEVQMLCQLRHPHLISLIGFCHEQNDEMILVYEYMSRGSLSDYLFGKTYDPLCWKQRLKICIGVARGLHYLHTGAKRAVIHRGIRCSTILVNDEGSSKISDFALSRMGPRSMSKPLQRMESRIVGTFAYMAPEYALYGELTEKADVFSFGVVLFEVLCGREECADVCLIDWAAECIREGTTYHIIDPYLQGKIAPDCFKKYLEIACSCVHVNRNERPDMGEVEVTLELALKLQEKADSEIEAINSYGEYMYKDSSFRSPQDYELSEHDSNSDNYSQIIVGVGNICKID
ncbi:hypothetical protein DITRI_Ditri13aG0155200 [Diplodiscus trichospermus]